MFTNTILHSAYLQILKMWLALLISLQLQLKLYYRIPADGASLLCYRCSYYVDYGGVVAGNGACNDPYYDSLETRQLAVVCNGVCVVGILSLTYSYTTLYIIL